MPESSLILTSTASSILFDWRIALEDAIVAYLKRDYPDLDLVRKLLRDIQNIFNTTRVLQQVFVRVFRVS